MSRPCTLRSSSAVSTVAAGSSVQAMLIASGSRPRRSVISPSATAISLVDSCLASIASGVRASRTPGTIMPKSRDCARESSLPKRTRTMRGASACTSSRASPASGLSLSMRASNASVFSGGRFGVLVVSICFRSGSALTIIGCRSSPRSRYGMSATRARSPPGMNVVSIKRRA